VNETCRDGGPLNFQAARHREGKLTVHIEVLGQTYFDKAETGESY
jgi:hypothetical protein